MATIGRIPDNKDRPETSHETNVRLCKELNELKIKEEELALRFAEWINGQAYCYLYEDKKWLVNADDMVSSKEMLIRYKSILSND